MENNKLSDVNSKSGSELIAIAHGIAANFESPATELLRELASRLECSIIRGNELQQKLDLARDKYRAEGIAASINHLLNKFEGTGMIGVPVMSLQWLLKEITSGTHDTADKAGV